MRRVLLGVLLLGFASCPASREFFAPGVTDFRSLPRSIDAAIVATPKGVMSDARAREENVGGEIICKVW